MPSALLYAGDAVDLYSGAISMGANARVQCFPEKVRDGCPNWRLRPDWATLTRLPWASSPERDVFRVWMLRAARQLGADTGGLGPRR